MDYIVSHLHQLPVCLVFTRPLEQNLDHVEPFIVMKEPAAHLTIIFKSAHNRMQMKNVGANVADIIVIELSSHRQEKHIF